MIQKIYFPQNPNVGKIVNFFSYSEFDTDRQLGNWLGIFPNATANMAFSLGDDLVKTDHSSTTSFVSAACTKALALKRTENFKIVSIQFNPYGLHHLLGIPMKELKDIQAPIDTFFKASEIETLSDKLHENKGIAEKLLVLEDFVLQQIRFKYMNPRLSFALNFMARPDVKNMDQLSSALCLSSRGMRKMFSQHIGMSPKYYSKMIRFNKAAKQLSKKTKGTLTSIAIDCGYFDQAHFIKDFRQFSGVSPSQFLSMKSKSTDFYNFVSDTPDIFD